MPEEISGPAEESVIVSAFTRMIERHAAYSLVASDGVSERLFYFAIGGIRVIRSGGRKTASIGDVLVEMGKITAKDVGRVAAAATQQGKHFAETCVALGLVHKSDMEEASRRKVQEDLLDLFLWEEAEIHLAEGQPPKAFYEGRFEAARIGCDVPAFLQTVLARVEEWRAVLGRLASGREVYEAPQVGRQKPPEEWKNRLLDLLDGTRTASIALTKCGGRRIAAYEFLLESLKSGTIKRVAGGTAQRISRDQLVREIEALEEALKVNADAVIVRRRLARALEQAGEKSRAAAQWRFLGDQRRRLNDLDGALAHYRSAVAISPTDFATREVILEIHRHKHDYGKLVADGRPLADVFVKHNLLNRAKNLLLALVRIAPNDAALRRQLVMVLIGLGEQDAALVHLRELARLLETQQADPSELRDVYLRILALDKRDKQARDRLDTLTGAKLHRRVLRATVGVAATLLAALGVAYGSERSTRVEVNDAIARAQERIDANDLAGAKEVLKEAVVSLAHARAAAAAKGMLERIEAYELKERERSHGVVGTAAERAKSAAEELVRRARTFAAGGRSDDAYRAYRELFELYGATPAVESVSIPLKVSVVPADAHVVLAGEDLGQGSVTLQYSPRAKCTLLVTREGYADWKRVLDGPQDAAIEVALSKPTRWTYESDASIDAPPVVQSGVVYVAGRDRRLTALSVADGGVQWSRPLGMYGDVAAPAIATAQGIFVATSRGDAMFVGASSGDLLWKKDVGAGVERRSALVGADVVVVPGDDGSLTAYDVAGAALWTTGVGVAKSAPAAIDSKVFCFVDNKGGLALADARTGVHLPDARLPISLRGSPVIEGGRAWSMADDQSLREIAAPAMRPLHRYAVTSPTDLPPTVADEHAYVACTDGVICAFRSSGEPLFTSKIDEPPSAAPAWSKGRLYVPGQKGRMYVLDAEKGALVWRFDAKSRITATPTIVDGTIYVPTAAGTLYALEE